MNGKMLLTDKHRCLFEGDFLLSVIYFFSLYDLDSYQCSVEKCSVLLVVQAPL